MSNQDQQVQLAGREIFEKSPIPSSLMKLRDLRYTEVNAAWCDFYGIAKEEALGKTPEELNIIDRKTLCRLLETFLSNGSVKGIEITAHTKTGEKKNVLTSIESFSFEGEKIIINMVVDITGRKKTEQDVTIHRDLERQLIQAQKMEAVGRLAGGVAHDFNNMLSLIICYAELAIEKTAADDQIHEDLEVILEAGKRSVEITRQLLGFARKQAITPRVLDLNEIAEEILKMFRRLIGEDIDLTWRPADGLWTVMIDPSQVDQILANLCVNARDAITGVGKISIETDNVIFDETYCASHEGSVPGEFVMLAVSDNGSGMDQETLDHIFEPFFTTKDSSKGTGLGLSTVYGIVKQNNGFITAYSEPGVGTTFKIYLPHYVGVPEKIKPTAVEEIPLPGQGEILLLVEDESLLLEVTKRMLEGLDYKVLTALTPTEAINIAQTYKGAVNLLITDVVLPEMNGLELAERIRTIHPDIKCLFMSGYTANAIARRGVFESDMQYIQKPFTYRKLATKVREVLEKEKEV